METYKHQLQILLEKHKQLDYAIDKLDRNSSTDSVELHELKKRKLMLKDEVGQIKNKILELSKTTT